MERKEKDLIFFKNWRDYTLPIADKNTKLEYSNHYITSHPELKLRSIKRNKF
jgi:hypothetical protein